MKLTEIFPKDGYRLFLRYDDGACGEVDLSSYAGRKAVIDIDILAFIDGHPRSANFKPRSSIRDLRPPTEVIFFAGHVGDNAASGKKRAWRLQTAATERIARQAAAPCRATLLAV
jgi:hypothetical protein